ncbi:L-lactate dehydrogenase A chain-like [Venturia canescens]|uniref:L-lactate dehydrogenase A chain-like n=1 Tax=Venturia canescens TaxID=32260 RepID=UPI001C9CA1E8|nr:L-lactate dehydrogenase A chain-like [Venturia canescens]
MSIHPQTEKSTVTATSTKSMLITTPLEDCESPHRVKVCVVGAGKVGMACALSILMKRIASEVCLIDKDSSMAEAEAEDIRHAGVFLGSPLVSGTSDITMVRDSAVVIIAMGERIPGEVPNVRHNLDIFKKVIPAIAKLACNAILLIVTQPIDVMSYVAWKISKFPSNRVLGTGTLLDTMRFQYYLSKRLGLANSSISCACIGAQGANSVPAWSGVHVGGVKLNDVNPRIGSQGDPERWHEVADSIHQCEERLDAMKGEKGPSCWALGVCTAEIVDAIVRNTRIILPASTYIHSCSHGTDKDVYMSVPCVLGREGVHHKVRQRLTDQEKSSLQACADSIRNALRDSGILRDTSEDLQD